MKALDTHVFICSDYIYINYILGMGFAQGPTDCQSRVYEDSVHVG